MVSGLWLGFMSSPAEARKCISSSLNLKEFSGFLLRSRALGLVLLLRGSPRSETIMSRKCSTCYTYLGYLARLRRMKTCPWTSAI